MADNLTYKQLSSEKKYVSEAEFSSLDKSSIAVGTEYNVVGSIEESDLSSELQTKINATTTYTGTSGVVVSGTTISAQLQDYTKEGSKASAASDGDIRPIKLDSEGNLSVKVPRDSVGAYSNNIQIITSGSSAYGFYYQVGMKSAPTFDSIYLTGTNLKASTSLTGITVSLPSKSGTIATLDDISLPKNPTFDGVYLQGTYVKPADSTTGITVTVPSRSGTLAMIDDLTGKQDKLTAGENIEITDNTIGVKSNPTFSALTVKNPYTGSASMQLGYATIEATTNSTGKYSLPSHGGDWSLVISSGDGDSTVYDPSNFAKTNEDNTFVGAQSFASGGAYVTSPAASLYLRSGGLKVKDENSESYYDVTVPAMSGSLVVDIGNIAKTDKANAFSGATTFNNLVSFNASVNMSDSTFSVSTGAQIYANNGAEINTIEGTLNCATPKQSDNAANKSYVDNLTSVYIDSSLIGG